MKTKDFYLSLLPILNAASDLTFSYSEERESLIAMIECDIPTKDSPGEVSELFYEIEVLDNNIIHGCYTLTDGEDSWWTTQYEGLYNILNDIEKFSMTEFKKVNKDSNSYYTYFNFN